MTEGQDEAFQMIFISRAKRLGEPVRSYDGRVNLHRVLLSASAELPGELGSASDQGETEWVKRYDDLYDSSVNRLHAFIVAMTRELTEPTPPNASYQFTCAQFDPRRRSHVLMTKSMVSAEISPGKALARDSADATSPASSKSSEHAVAIAAALETDLFTTSKQELNTRAKWLATTVLAELSSHLNFIAGFGGILLAKRESVGQQSVQLGEMEEADQSEGESGARKRHKATVVKEEHLTESLNPMSVQINKQSDVWKNCLQFCEKLFQNGVITAHTCSKADMMTLLLPLLYPATANGATRSPASSNLPERKECCARTMWTSLGSKEDFKDIATPLFSKFVNTDADPLTFSQEVLNVWVTHLDFAKFRRETLESMLNKVKVKVNAPTAKTLRDDLIALVPKDTTLKMLLHAESPHRQKTLVVGEKTHRGDQEPGAGKRAAGAGLERMRSDGAGHVQNLLAEPSGKIWGMCPVTGGVLWPSLQEPWRTALSVQLFGRGPRGPVLGLLKLEPEEEGNSGTQATFLVFCGSGDDGQETLFGTITVNTSLLLQTKSSDMLKVQFSMLPPEQAQPYIDMSFLITGAKATSPSWQDAVGYTGLQSCFLWPMASASGANVWKVPEDVAKGEKRGQVLVPVNRLQLVFMLGLLDMLQQESTPEREKSCGLMCVGLAHAEFQNWSTSACEQKLPPPRSVVALRWQNPVAPEPQVESAKRKRGAAGSSAAAQCGLTALGMDASKPAQGNEIMTCLIAALRAAATAEDRGPGKPALVQGFTFNLPAGAYTDANAAHEMMSAAADKDYHVIGLYGLIAMDPESLSVAAEKDLWQELRAVLVQWEEATGSASGKDGMSDVVLGEPLSVLDQTVDKVLQLCTSDDQNANADNYEADAESKVMLRINIFRVRALKNVLDTAIVQRKSPLDYGERLSTAICTHAGQKRNEHKDNPLLQLLASPEKPSPASSQSSSQPVLSSASGGGGDKDNISSSVRNP